MFLARTRVFLPLLSGATIAAGITLLLTDSSRTNFLGLFSALLLLFLGCAMLIVWSAGLTFRENNRNASAPHASRQI